MTNMKTEMNHNLLTQTIEKINNMEYSAQTVKFIARVLEDLRNDTIENGARFALRYFLHKGLIKFGRERRDALTK